MKTNEPSNIMFCFAIFLLALSFLITMFHEPATLSENNVVIEGMNITFICNALSIMLIFTSGRVRVNWNYSFFFIPLYIFLFLYAIFSLFVSLLLFAASAIEVD